MFTATFWLWKTANSWTGVKETASKSFPCAPSPGGSQPRQWSPRPAPAAAFQEGHQRALLLDTSSSWPFLTATSSLEPLPSVSSLTCPHQEAPLSLLPTPCREGCPYSAGSLARGPAVTLHTCMWNSLLSSSSCQHSWLPGYPCLSPISHHLGNLAQLLSRHGLLLTSSRGVPPTLPAWPYL